MPDKKHRIVSSKPISTNTIAVGNVKNSPTIKSNQPKEKLDKWYFGFKYFNQIRYFEIGGVENSWFISLIERLKFISGIDREKFLTNFANRGALRYHEINWNGINVPIQRKDLHWLDKDYLENEEEYPMVQFHISKALGRVVGFWDDNNVFQVVLLDPAHNIQPSNYNTYHIDDTYYMSCQYSSLLIDIQNVQKKINSSLSCAACAELNKLPTQINTTNFFYCSLDEDYKNKLLSSNKTIQEIIELGLLQC